MPEPDLSNHTPGAAGCGLWAGRPRASIGACRSRTNADDCLPLASPGRVQGGDGIVEGRDVADVRPQSSVPHPLDDLTQLGAIALDNDALKDVGGVDLVFDVIGGDIGKRSARLIRAGGTLVTIAGPTEARPADGLAIDFVLVSDRAQLSQIVQRVRDGRLRTNIGNIATLDDAVAAFNRTERRKGKTIIRVRP